MDVYHQHLHVNICSNKYIAAEISGENRESWDLHISCHQSSRQHVLVCSAAAVSDVKSTGASSLGEWALNSPVSSARATRQLREHQSPQHIAWTILTILHNRGAPWTVTPSGTDCAHMPHMSAPRLIPLLSIFQGGGKLSWVSVGSIMGWSVSP